MPSVLITGANRAGLEFARQYSAMAGRFMRLVVIQIPLLSCADCERPQSAIVGLLPSPRRYAKIFDTNLWPTLRSHLSIVANGDAS
jgi:hypothetical protein